MRTSKSIGSACFILLAMAAACQQEVGAPVGSETGDIDKPEATGQTSGTLLTSLKLSDDHVVEIHEFASGELAVNERGRNGERPSTTEGMILGQSMASLYRLLTADRPELRKQADLETLELADLRAKDFKRPLVKESEPETLASETVGTSTAEHDPEREAWFRSNHCGGVNSGWCNTHWNGDARSPAVHDKWAFFSAVDNYDTGNLRHYGYKRECNIFGANCTWEQKWDHSIAPGHWEHWGWQGVGDRQSRVVGNGFHFGGKWSNTAPPEPPANCGQLNQPCCGWGLCSGTLLTCALGTCQPCGYPGQLCCANSNGTPPGCVNGGVSGCGFNNICL